jgi:hypothetical protein
VSYPKTVKTFLASHEIEMIDWPPYSPDLNLIRLETKYSVCTSAEEIEALIFEIWNTITPETCLKYCGSYEKSLLAVIAVNGGYKKYQ